MLLNRQFSRGGRGCYTEMCLCYLFLLGVLTSASKAQLQVQIREYRAAWSEIDVKSTNHKNLADYSFPHGFSQDWFITVHANIPPEGIIGLLYYIKPSLNGCPPSNYSLDDCSLTLKGSGHRKDERNISKLVLFDNYHLCIQQKLDFVREAGFDGFITYSPKDRFQDVGVVYDKSIGSTVDVVGTGIPIAVVSEKFAGLLLSIAVIRNCSELTHMSTLVSMNVGPIDPTSVHVAWIVFVISCAVLTLCIPLTFYCCIFYCDKRRRRAGSYDVYGIQMQQLGNTDDGMFRRTLSTLYTPEQKEFTQKEGDCNVSCPICLENLINGEMVSILKCDGNHIFHPNCISKWFESQSTCPVCRTLMVKPA